MRRHRSMSASRKEYHTGGMRIMVFRSHDCGASLHIRSSAALLGKGGHGDDSHKSLSNLAEGVVMVSLMHLARDHDHFVGQLGILSTTIHQKLCNGILVSAIKRGVYHMDMISKLQKNVVEEMQDSPAIMAGMETFRKSQNRDKGVVFRAAESWIRAVKGFIFKRWALSIGAQKVALTRVISLLSTSKQANGKFSVRKLMEMWRYESQVTKLRDMLCYTKELEPIVGGLKDKLLTFTRNLGDVRKENFEWKARVKSLAYECRVARDSLESPTSDTASLHNIFNSCASSVYKLLPCFMDLSIGNLVRKPRQFAATPPWDAERIDPNIRLYDLLARWANDLLCIVKLNDSTGEEKHPLDKHHALLQSILKTPGNHVSANTHGNLSKDLWCWLVGSAGTLGALKSTLQDQDIRVVFLAKVFMDQGAPEHFLMNVSPLDSHGRPWRVIGEEIKQEMQE